MRARGDRRPRARANRHQAPPRRGNVRAVHRRIALPAVLVASLAACSPAAAARLQAGVGRSDVTPPTGFPTMGYVRSDAIARGQHTRLLARAIVLREGDRKLALVTTDLGFTPGGMVTEVAARLASRGFGERDIVIS